MSSKKWLQAVFEIFNETLCKRCMEIEKIKRDIEKAKGDYGAACRAGDAEKMDVEDDAIDDLYIILQEWNLKQCRCVEPITPQ